MNITFVTAASSNHFKSACQFLTTVRGHQVVFYDIGLTADEATQIRRTFNIDYRVFNFNQYPPFVSLSSRDAGAYAWKPIIVAEVFSQINGVLIWCDAGNKITDAGALVECVRRAGMYTPTSSGTIERWTHPTTLSALGVPSSWYGFDMRNAACVGFLKGSADAVVAEWKHYALNENVILPTGANRTNHRHDQSVLTFLFYKYNVSRQNDYVGFTIHNDID